MPAGLAFFGFLSVIETRLVTLYFPFPERPHFYLIQKPTYFRYGKI